MSKPYGDHLTVQLAKSRAFQPATQEMIQKIDKPRVLKVDRRMHEFLSVDEIRVHIRLQPIQKVGCRPELPLNRGAFRNRWGISYSLLMGLERQVVAQQFCRSDRVIGLWIEMFNRAGIDALTTKRRARRGRRVKLEGLRDLLVPVLENPRQAGELHWTGENPRLAQRATRARGGLQHHGALPP